MPIPAAFFLVVSLFVLAPDPEETFRDCDLCPEMVVVPPGSFLMGADDYRDYEKPRHDVAIERSFAVSKFPVTVELFEAYVKDRTPPLVLPDLCWAHGADGKTQHTEGLSWDSPGFEQGPDHPVVCVSWADAQHFIRWLSRKAGRTYRFLSEAEWEYVARAGASDKELRRLGEPGGANWGRAPDPPDAEPVPCCWGATNGDDVWTHTAPVTAFPPNAFGVSGMAGNVTEMVADCVNGDYVGAPSDGSVWTTALRRDTDWARSGSTENGMCIDHMTRGPGWPSIPNPRWYVRRGWWYIQMSANFNGFRVATSLE